MHLLVCYDVNTETPAGRKRLRKVAAVCKEFGQRVQYSVFECTVSETNRERLRQRLLEVINPAVDNLRLYQLAAKRTDVVETYGHDPYVDFTGPLVI